MHVDQFAAENPDVAEGLQMTLERALLRARSVQLRNKPSENVSKSINLLMDIDPRLFGRLDEEEKETLKADLDELKKIVSRFQRQLVMVEFEPNKLIQFSKLEKAGVTQEKIREYCDNIYETVADGVYFSIQSLRQDGFEHELFELGFSDWFYASLLMSDNRFAVAQMYGVLVFCKNEPAITIQSFLVNRIREHRMIDVYDLLTELTERFGCNVEDKSRIPYRLDSTEVYHDNILDRYYANADDRRQLVLLLPRFLQGRHRHHQRRKRHLPREVHGEEW